MSSDLDYVSYDELKKIEASLKKIGFVKKGKYFEHPDCKFYIDFVSEPVAIGKEIIRTFEELQTQYGTFKLLTVTDCVKDRLASFYHWNDRQGFNQALDVCLDHEIDIKAIHEWSKVEGFEEKFQTFAKELKSLKPFKRQKSLR
jgi:hypothetical protein